MSTFRPSTLAPSNSGSIRQSPFKRQNSHSPAPNFQRASAPGSTSPTKASHLSPTKTSSLSLSPEKASPFVRRPSQNSQGSTSRPASPFARPTSGLNAPPSPSAVRKASVRSGSDESADVVGEVPASPGRLSSPVVKHEDVDEREDSAPPTPVSPTPLGAQHSPVAFNSPPAPRHSQANLRPTAQRTVTSSTVSTIRQPAFTSNSFDQPSNPFTSTATSKPLGSPYNPIPRASNTSRGPTPATRIGASAGVSYTSLPPPLLHALRSSFEVLDPSCNGTLTAASLPQTLQQLALPEDPTPYFPPGAPQSLTLASYLETLSAPFSQLSSQEELLAAFGAFDQDDSGQVDMGELTKALLSTGPEGGEEDWRLNEREVERVTAEFVGRRAFGGKPGGGGNRGEVFRYREFVGRLGGGGGAGEEIVA